MIDKKEQELIEAQDEARRKRDENMKRIIK